MKALVNGQVLALARSKLSAQAWDKLMGGTESEITLRRNRGGFDSLALRPRIQSEDATIDPSTTFLGHRLRIPVMTAPIGSLHVFTADGAAASARAVAQFGSIAFVSSASHEGFEAIASQTAAPRVLQLAIRGDLDWCADVMERARASGYMAVCVTVDTARLGRQERQIVNSGGAQAVEHPFRTGLTWADLLRIKELAGLPLIVKGIATREDAAIAVDHGVEAICVSNHGGHGLDHGRGTIDVLPEVVEAVDGRAEIILDGAVMRGTDVIKAIARGARATLIGKLQGIALAAGGEAALLRVLENLEDELTTSLELLGVARSTDITPQHVTPVPAVEFPSETSAFSAAECLLA